MTHEEAFKILRDTPVDIRSTREDDILTLYATAQLIALDCIEKQMPKKPAVRNYAKWSGCACGMKIYDPFSYCPYCGQAIDWEVE